MAKTATPALSEAEREPIRRVTVANPLRQSRFFISSHIDWRPIENVQFQDLPHVLDPRPAAPQALPRQPGLANRQG